MPMKYKRQTPTVIRSGYTNCTRKYTMNSYRYKVRIRKPEARVQMPKADISTSYNLNIIILLSSYPFISLINCPWLLFVIILLSSSFMALSGFLFIYIIIAINYWIRDVIREYTKKYEVLIIMLFIVFLVFVFSEGLLFLSFFWVFFHSSCSPATEDGIYVPDPCELTYTNTLLLSNAALSLGCTFICREAVLSIDEFGGNISIISFILAWTFISLQIKEFHTLAFYINDSIFGSIFFFLTGLHFFHVIVGIILIGIILCSFPLTIPRLTFYVLPFHLYYNLQLIYWHFIELLWLFIYIILYSY